MKLSILIPTLQSREKQFNQLIDFLMLHGEPYIGKFQIISHVDNREMSVGAKRNYLLSMAKGDYVSFIDDDDTVSSEYISSIIQETNRNFDAICFRVMRYDRGQIDRPVFYSNMVENDHNTPNMYYRLPNHLMAVKREHAIATGFKEVNFGEDADYAVRLKPLLKTECQIDKVLYNYMYDSRTSETVNRK